MLKTIVKGCEPTKCSKYSAYMDLYASEDVVIGIGETISVGLGVVIDLDYIADNTKVYKWAKRRTTTTTETLAKIRKDALSEFMENHQLNIYIENNLSTQKRLIVPIGTGIINLDFKDEIKICLHNLIDKNYIDNVLLQNKSNKCYGQVLINKGDKIAQISLIEHKSYFFGVKSNDK